LMVQGTGSHSGKTLLAAALCRLFSRSGYRVAPFKAQNMSLNSSVTKDGAEISRAQAFQAFAAGVEAAADMNPILLKPKDTKTCQVIVQGRPRADLDYRQYTANFALTKGLEAVRDSYSRLASSFDVVVIEGAGCPAEVNLKRYDIANMRIAEMARAPVILVGNIDRGGVFAGLVGTISLLSKRERARVKGLVINNLRGDSTLLKPGIKIVQKATGKRVLGVIPHIPNLTLPQEDSVSLRDHTPSNLGRFEIAVVRLPRISNFTDFDPLCMIEDFKLRYVSFPSELGLPDLIILPGTKNTMSDLKWLMTEGLGAEILKLSKAEVPIIGICGGFQMLGKTVVDRKGIEDGLQTVQAGLSLLDITTEFEEYSKLTRRVSALAVGGGPILGQAGGSVVEGYEIHMGRTLLGPDARPAFKILDDKREEAFDGAVDSSGLVFGTYIHGLFDRPPMSEALLRYLALKKGLEPRTQDFRPVSQSWASSISLVADVVSRSLDILEIYRIVGLDPESVPETPDRESLSEPC